MVINVTQEHIDKGEKFNGQKCPVGLALQEIFGEGKASAGTITYHYYNPSLTLQYLPGIAQQFIRLFDLGCEVEPFSFEIP